MGKALNYRIVHFWDWVNKTEKCWFWTGGTNSSGYGLVSANYKTLSAHRVVWELTYGPIPEGICVLHTCDVRSCVRPSHLFLGTKLDNRVDMIRKGRQRNYTPPGEEHLQSKLTDEQVHRIRSMWASGKFLQKELAEYFKIAQSNLCLIVNRKKWIHLE